MARSQSPLDSILSALFQFIQKLFRSKPKAIDEVDLEAESETIFSSGEFRRKVNRTADVEADEPVYPFEGRMVFSDAEASLFHMLIKVVGESVCVLAKVRLADVIQVTPGSDGWRGQFNKIKSKHLDFVVLSRKSLKTMLCIELDDRSHQREDRVKRDEFVEEALTVAKVPLLRIRCRRGYRYEGLKSAIKTAMINGGTTHF